VQRNLAAAWNAEPAFRCKRRARIKAAPPPPASALAIPEYSANRVASGRPRRDFARWVRLDPLRRHRTRISGIRAYRRTQTCISGR
jgi:hypothetical protein